jgi:hypothetical protein
LVSGKVRWRGRSTASDELLGPASSRDARRGRASVRSMVAIWVQLVAPLPSAALMKAHLPGVPPSAIIFGRRNGRALARFGPRFGDHVVANLEADVPELPGFALYREAERQFSAV